jgi:cardiolipin synthase
MDATPPHLARLAQFWQRGPEGRLDRAFSRIAESDLRLGNGVRLLKDARENYPAWLEAIHSAQSVIHFENFIVANDETGRTFAEALAERARAGVTVRVLYDWLGSTPRALPPFWAKLQQAGVEVRVFNPPRLAAPFWIRRDHRKLITVDGRVGFVSGLCVSDNWQGSDEAEPWRDTGISLAGPVVADLDEAFAEMWALTGPALPAHEIPDPDRIPLAGDVAARVIKGRPGAYRTYRLDQFVAATARRNLWLTDAYLVANTSYVQALAEAARDGVDVRLLVPGSSDVPMLQPIVRAGYRPLIEAGIRVFEWNGAMLHAKTAVADGRWARVGSTNLNPTSWATNWELDVVVEDEGFAAEMEAMYLEDLANATEIVPGWRPRAKGRPAARKAGRPARRRSVGRLAAGAIALGNTVGTAIAGSRTLAGTEVRSVATIGVLLLALAAVVTVAPVLVISPLVITLAWFGLALLLRAFRLGSVMRRSRKAQARGQEPERHAAPAE